MIKQNCLANVKRTEIMKIGSINYKGKVDLEQVNGILKIRYKNDIFSSPDQKKVEKMFYKKVDFDRKIKPKDRINLYN